MALRYFDIKDTAPSECLHEFINQLMHNWPELTLNFTRKSEAAKHLKRIQNIDPTKSGIRFLGSLITDGQRSELVEYLQKKKPEDFNAMERIVDGSLVAAYGNEK